MSIILGEKGERRLLLGNEAIARGVLEAGVGYVAAYPGTPSSEIVDTLAEVSKTAGIYVEWSVNEKVAYESAFAACVCGVRAFFACKHVGVNVAADAIATSAYVGTNAGFVFVSADDPHAHSSQNEQDNRHYARMFGLILLEPSTPQEAKDFTVLGYELSEKTKLPVMLRTTTRVSHSRGVVTFGEIRRPKVKGRFEKNPQRFVVVPANARRNHAWLVERLRKAQEISESIEINRVFETSGKECSVGRLGIVGSGVAFNYAREAAAELGLSAKFFKLGMSYPLPARKLVKFMEDVDVVLVVEEVDDVLERDLKALAKEHELPVKIVGKSVLPRVFELRPEIVHEALRRVSEGNFSPVAPASDAPAVREVEVPVRPPMLCPGCPHRAAYFAVKRALVESGIRMDDVIFPTDIGCMTLGFQPPYRMGDFLLCMGSSTGSSCGFSSVTDQLVVAFIGDSTFYHAGIPGLLNAVYNGHPYILVVLDNRVTAMTGFQPDPSTGITARGEKAPVIDISELAKAIGAVTFVADPVLAWRKAKEEFKRALAEYRRGKVVVFIFRHPCALYERRVRGVVGKGGRYQVNREKCVNCGMCYKQFNCPAIILEEGKPKIREDLCVGCGVCEEICPVGAIQRVDSPH